MICAQPYSTFSWSATGFPVAQRLKLFIKPGFTNLPVNKLHAPKKGPSDLKSDDIELVCYGVHVYHDDCIDKPPSITLLDSDYIVPNFESIIAPTTTSPQDPSKTDAAFLPLTSS